MNPSSPPPNPSPPPASRVVVPQTTRREMLIAVACGVAAVGLLGYGLVVMNSGQQKATTNTLTGKVKSKSFAPAPEDQISFDRKKGMKAQHIAGEYIFEVYVKSENRTFEVPVDGNTYEAVRVGDSFSFLRPHSEQVR